MTREISVEVFLRQVQTWFRCTQQKNRPLLYSHQSAPGI
jgi:hypothetical protein